MTEQYTDVELNFDSGYYDISFESGDFKKIKGFDTSIWISILTDGRAAATQVERPERRRGWIGNSGNPVELGGLNWLYDQARLVISTVNGLMDSTRKSLQWFIDFGYATNVTATPIRSADKLEADVKIFRPDGSVESKRVTLWEQTPNRDG